MGQTLESDGPNTGARTPVRAFHEEARHCQGRSEEFSADGMFDRASIRTRLTSLGTWCSMKFDLAALLSLSRPLGAGRGLAVAANSVCPCTVVIPDPSPDTTIPASPASGRLRFESRQGARSCDPLSLLPVCRASDRPGAVQGARSAAQRTLDGEDRSGILPAEGKGIRCSCRSAKILPSRSFFPVSKTPGAEPGRISQRLAAAREFVL